MKAYDILGFTGDADTYCHDCAETRYGPDREGRLDGEGNEVRPIFANESGDWAETGAFCSDCGAEIVEAEEPEPEEESGPEPYFDRFDVVEAFMVFAHDHGLYGLVDRIERIPFRPRPSLRRETLSENGEAIYRSLERRGAEREYGSYGRNRRES